MLCFARNNILITHMVFGFKGMLIVELIFHSAFFFSFCVFAENAVMTRMCDEVADTCQEQVR